MWNKALGMLAATALLGVVAIEAKAQRVTVVTNQQGTMAYSTGAALAKVMNDKLGAQARIQPTGGSSTYLPLLDRGEAQYGFANAVEAMFAQTGTGLYEGRAHKNVKIVSELFGLQMAMIVRADSPARSIADLRGMSVGTRFTSQRMSAFIQDALLANGGLTLDDMRGIPVVNSSANIMGVGQGKIDTSFAPPGSGVAQNAHAAASSVGGIRFLPLDESPEAMARMRKIVPSAYALRIKPAANFPGVTEEIPIMSYPFLLIASGNVSEEDVYRLVKMMHESKGDLAKAFPAFNRFDPKAMARMTQGEFHSGAIRFYKEAGIWPR